jgi:S-adenosylmethionine hydrolase
LIGSSSRLEIAVVNGNAAVELRAEVGDVVTVVKADH